MHLHVGYHLDSKGAASTKLAKQRLLLIACDKSGRMTATNGTDRCHPFTPGYSHGDSAVVLVKTVHLSAQKQTSVSAGLHLFRPKDQTMIEEIYEAVVVTLDSVNCVRLFAVSAPKSKSKA